VAFTFMREIGCFSRLNMHGLAPSEETLGEDTVQHRVSSFRHCEVLLRPRLSRHIDHLLVSPLLIEPEMRYAVTRVVPCSVLHSKSTNNNGPRCGAGHRLKGVKFEFSQPKYNSMTNHKQKAKMESAANNFLLCLNPSLRTYERPLQISSAVS
jgi:hypothetical protein